ncbi:hypothetical protein [Helicobacter cholecystus]|uniref:hypothetical protein n=1 Tax=Helicobacter cholecystus TaxID=45498 RepID=UPI002738AA2A|nr:hypothetical protein [Helicobacter cholecystus]
MSPQLPQIQEILELIKEAKTYSVEMLERIEKLCSVMTQMQGRNTFVQQCLKEQAQVMKIVSEQNPEFEIFKSSKDQIQEALLHSLALTQLSERGLEILEVSANTSQEQEGIAKASLLLKSVIGCLDMLLGEKIEDFIQTTANNQNAGIQEIDAQSLQSLKHHFYLKGAK